jgi:hypothetical protein
MFERPDGTVRCTKKHEEDGMDLEFWEPLGDGVYKPKWPDCRYRSLGTTVRPCGKLQLVVHCKLFGIVERRTCVLCVSHE